MRYNNPLLETKSHQFLNQEVLTFISAISLSVKRRDKMYILRIEHPVPSYESWKKTFDSDPVDRARSGVRRYQVSRPVDNPNYVLIDLEFDTATQAEALLAAMRTVWKRVEGTLIMSPQVKITEVVETKAY
jgi:hypothetical protein